MNRKPEEYKFFSKRVKKDQFEYEKHDSGSESESDSEMDIIENARCDELQASKDSEDYDSEIEELTCGISSVTTVASSRASSNIMKPTARGSSASTNSLSSSSRTGSRVGSGYISAIGSVSSNMNEDNRDLSNPDFERVEKIANRRMVTAKKGFTGLSGLKGGKTSNSNQDQGSNSVNPANIVKDPSSPVGGEKGNSERGI